MQCPRDVPPRDVRYWSRRYPFDFASYLPTSWKELHHHNDTKDELRLAFTHAFRGHTTSALTVQAASREKYPEKTEFLKELFSTWLEQGLNPSEINYQPGPMLGELKTLEGVTTFTYQGTEGSTDYEYRFLLAEPENCWFAVDLIGLSKQVDFESWAINNRARNIFVENFKHCT